MPLSNILQNAVWISETGNKPNPHLIFHVHLFILPTTMFLKTIFMPGLKYARGVHIFTAFLKTEEVNKAYLVLHVS